MISFSDDELEIYFRKQAEAEEYLNQLIRRKRIEQIQKQKLNKSCETLKIQWEVINKRPKNLDVARITTR